MSNINKQIRDPFQGAANNPFKAANPTVGSNWADRTKYLQATPQVTSQAPQRHLVDKFDTSKKNLDPSFKADATYKTARKSSVATHYQHVVNSLENGTINQNRHEDSRPSLSDEQRIKFLDAVISQPKNPTNQRTARPNAAVRR